MYGIEDNDRFYIDSMMQKQIDYLLANDFNTMSANIVPAKYLAELNNRISALVKVVQDDNCVPIFLTITAPSRFHPSSKRYNNESIHATSLYLSLIWKKLLNTNVFKRIKKNGLKRHFIRTYEPHKSGVPHLHALMYIPKSYIKDFKRAFIRLMHDEKIRQYKFLFQFKKAGYNSNFEGSKAYILKYILKSLKSAKDGTISDIGYWYIKHKIRRISISNSLVPLHIFRKINYIEDYRNIYQVNIHYKNSRLVLSQRKSYIELFYFDIDDLRYSSKILWSKPVSLDLLSDISRREPLKLRKRVKEVSYPDKIPVYNGDNRYIGFIKDSVYQKDFFEYQHYKNYNDFHLFDFVKYLEDLIDSGIDVNITKYAVFKEEAKRRGLFAGEPIPIDDYNDSFDIIDVFLE